MLVQAQVGGILCMDEHDLNNATATLNADRESTCKVRDVRSTLFVRIKPVLS
jgi:hypothetical protein